MPSERIQRQIDRFLDEAESAMASRGWDVARESIRAVLAIDEANADALAILAMVEAAAGDGPSSADGPTGAVASLEPTPQPDAPSAFAGGRYEVREFLGEGGKKRVFLAHDSLLDREVAFALIRIAKKLELQGVGSSDGSDGVTIVAPEPGETLPSGGLEAD